MTKLFAEYLKEADDNPANIIMSVAELIRKDMDADNEVAKTSVPFFLMQLRNAGLPISYSGLKAYYNAHPELKNVIQTFNDEDIIFVGQGDEADGETLGEPQGDIPPEEVVDNMAKRAMNKRMNELDDNMIEGKDKGASKEEEDEFHVALDDLVHKTFGHSSMEKKKKMEDSDIPTHVPSGKFEGDKIIVGKEEDEYEPEPDFESVQEGTEMGQIGDVHIKQFGMGKGQVGIQLTSDKGQGYVQLNKEDAAKLAARLARWAGSSELAQPGEYESVNEEVSDEVYVDKSFNASMNLINRMEGKFSPGKALGRKIDAIGGDSSTLKDIAEALGNVYEALEDGHYNAMGHIQGESKK